MARKSVSLRTKLAAALLTIVRPNDRGQLEPVIPHDHAKLMSDDQIISLFQWDHYPIPHAHDGPDEAWNLRPLLIAEHRSVTAEHDIPQIAKTKRLNSGYQDFIAKALEKPCGAKREKTGNWKPGRKIGNRRPVKAEPKHSATRPIVRKSDGDTNHV